MKKAMKRLIRLFRKAWRMMRDNVSRNVPNVLVPFVYLVGGIFWLVWMFVSIRRVQRSSWGLH